MAGTGLLAGIGFTMSLFVGGLAFEEGGLLDQAKLRVLSASVLAAVLGLTLLGWVPARTPPKPSSCGRNGFLKSPLPRSIWLFL